MEKGEGMDAGFYFVGEIDCRLFFMKIATIILLIKIRKTAFPSNTYNSYTASYYHF